MRDSKSKIITGKQVRDYMNMRELLKAIGYLYPPHEEILEMARDEVTSDGLGIHEIERVYADIMRKYYEMAITRARRVVYGVRKIK